MRHSSDKNLNNPAALSQINNATLDSWKILFNLESKKETSFGKDIYAYLQNPSNENKERAMQGPNLDQLPASNNGVIITKKTILASPQVESSAPKPSATVDNIKLISDGKTDLITSLDIFNEEKENQSWNVPNNFQITSFLILLKRS